MATDEQLENTRQAIGVMTAWTTESQDLAVQMVAEKLAEGIEESSSIASGLLNLCGLLLILRERETGATGQETLQYVASRPWNAGPTV